MAGRRQGSDLSWEGQGQGLSPGRGLSVDTGTPPTTTASSTTSPVSRSHDASHIARVSSHESTVSVSAASLRAAMITAFDDAVTFARNCSLFGVLLLVGIDMVKVANDTVLLGMGSVVDETLLTKGNTHPRLVSTHTRAH